jgi:hypothetical protein
MGRPDAAAAGASALGTDLGALAAAIAGANIDKSDLIFVASSRLSTVIKVAASFKFDNLVLGDAGQVHCRIRAGGDHQRVRRSTRSRNDKTSADQLRKAGAFTKATAVRRQAATSN